MRKAAEIELCSIAIYRIYSYQPPTEHNQDQICDVSRQRHPPPISLTLEGIQIPQVDSVKYLGVILSKDLSWTRYINSICTDAKRRVGLLHRQFGLAGVPCLTQLYKTLILPFLDYCSCVWDSNYVLYTDKLESVQDFATKVITQQWNSCYDDQLKLLILARLSTSRKRQKLSLCYRIVTGQSIIPPSFFIQSYCPSVFLLC